MSSFLRIFFLTSFESKEIVIAKIKLLNPTYWVVGEEVCPTTGKIHQHVYAELDKQRRFTALGHHFGCHVEPIKKHPETKKPMYYQAMMYVKKDGKFEEYGTPPEKPEEPTEKKRKREDIFVDCIKYARLNNLKQIRIEYPIEYVTHLPKWRMIAAELKNTTSIYNRKCLWIHGKSGIGKSRWASVTFPKAYRKNAMEEHFERYSDQDTIIIEDMLPEHKKSWNYLLLMISDIYAFTAKIRYGSVPLKHNTLIVTSNYSIEEIFPFREGETSPWRRRFIELEVNQWSDKANDLIIKDNKMWPSYLRNILIEHYLI